MLLVCAPDERREKNTLHVYIGCGMHNALFFAYGGAPLRSIEDDFVHVLQAAYR